jgi:hypothetical protein
MARAIDLDGRTTEAEQAGERGSGRELDLLILGPVPPPFGGISIHLDRLVPLLQEAGLKVGVLNHFSSKARPFVVGTLERNPLRYFWLPRKIRTKIVHYHHVRWPHLVAVALGRRGRSARYIVTLHGRGILRFFPRAGSRVSPLAPVTKWALGCFDLVIVVNPDVASIIRDSLPGRRIEVIPAFVEPAARPGAGRRRVRRPVPQRRPRALRARSRRRVIPPAGGGAKESSAGAVRRAAAGEAEDAPSPCGA